MEMHAFYLVLALVVMLPPLPFYGEVRRTLSSSRRNARVNAAATARVWQNWVDFIRAAFGAYLLKQWTTLADAQAPGSEEKHVLITALILSIVLLVQTVRILRNVQLLAPIFYLCGLTLVFGGWAQGAFAVAVGWLFAIGGKNLAYQLPAMAVALAAAGYVLGLGTPLLLNCALIFLPLVLSLLFRRRLLVAAANSAMA